MTRATAGGFLGGTAEMRSLPFSRLWTLTQDKQELLRARRHVWHRCSVIDSADSTWVALPGGWGTYVLWDGDEEEARAVRHQWRGRVWELVGRRPFAYELTSHSMLRRRWSIGQAGQQLMRISGGRNSFNRMTFQADVPIPLSAVALTWHIIVRAWEASGRGEPVGSAQLR